MWHIELDHARQICEVTALTIPILALAYLVSDSDKLSPRRSGTNPPGEPVSGPLVPLAEQTTNIAFALIFCMATFLGIFGSILGLLFKPYSWLLALAVLCLGTCVLLILIGIINSLFDELHNAFPEDFVMDSFHRKRLPPSARLSLRLGLGLIIVVWYLTPIALVSFCGLVVFNTTIS